MRTEEEAGTLNVSKFYNLTGTMTTSIEQPKTEKDVNQPEKPQQRHPRTPTNKPNHTPPSALYSLSLHLLPYHNQTKHPLPMHRDKLPRQRRRKLPLRQST